LKSFQSFDDRDLVEREAKCGKEWKPYKCAPLIKNAVYLILSIISLFFGTYPKFCVKKFLNETTQFIFRVMEAVFINDKQL
jgi:hypothetical protein